MKPAALLIATALAMPLAVAASAGELSQAQLDLLDNRAAQQYRNSVRLQPSYIHVPSKWGTGAYQGAYRGPYLEMARAAALKHHVPVDLFLKLVQQESGWNPAAISPKGAIGLAQLMPATARSLRVNARDPKQNLEGGARYLSKQYRRFNSWRLALAAYNAGPEAVERYKCVPPYKETQAYIKAIWGS